jgi:hypothetical protein
MSEMKNKIILEFYKELLPIFKKYDAFFDVVATEDYPPVFLCYANIKTQDRYYFDCHELPYFVNELTLENKIKEIEG